MGSGKLIRAAQEKYHLDSFSKDILFIFDNEEEMDSKEAELVTKDFVKLSSNYNMCPGGHGGWGYINSEEDLRKEKNRRARQKTNEIHGDKLSSWGSRGAKVNLEKNGVSQSFITAGRTSFLGKTHTDEWRKRQSDVMRKYSGEKASQFGTMWITDGINNQKIKKDVDIIPEGWYKGRVMKR